MDYEYEYYSDEERLLSLIENGPVATWMDISKEFQFAWGGGQGPIF